MSFETHVASFCVCVCVCVRACVRACMLVCIVCTRIPMHLCLFLFCFVSLHRSSAALATSVCREFRSCCSTHACFVPMLPVWCTPVVPAYM